MPFRYFVFSLGVIRRKNEKTQGEITNKCHAKKPKKNKKRKSKLTPGEKTKNGNLQCEKTTNKREKTKICHAKKYRLLFGGGVPQCGVEALA